LGIGRARDWHARRGCGHPTLTDGDNGTGIGKVPWPGMTGVPERCGSKARMHLASFIRRK